MQPRPGNLRKEQLPGYLCLMDAERGCMAMKHVIALSWYEYLRQRFKKITTYLHKRSKYSWIYHFQAQMIVRQVVFTAGSKQYFPTHWWKNQKDCHCS
jgi:hypothetical protein